MNTKKMIPLLVFTLIIISSLIYAGNTTSKETISQNTQTKEIKLSDIQMSACNAADIGGTCQTKLARLGLVSSADCCYYMGKCC